MNKTILTDNEGFEKLCDQDARGELWLVSFSPLLKRNNGYRCTVKLPEPGHRWVARPAGQGLLKMTQERI